MQRNGCVSWPPTVGQSTRLLGGHVALQGGMHLLRCHRVLAVSTYFLRPLYVGSCNVQRVEGACKREQAACNCAVHNHCPSGAAQNPTVGGAQCMLKSSSSVALSLFYHAYSCRDKANSMSFLEQLEPAQSSWACQLAPVQLHTAP